MQYKDKLAICFLKIKILLTFESHNVNKHGNSLKIKQPCLLWLLKMYVWKKKNTSPLCKTKWPRTTIKYTKSPAAKISSFLKNIIIMFGLNIIYMLLYISNKEFELASSSPYYAWRKQ